MPEYTTDKVQETFDIADPAFRGKYKYSQQWTAKDSHNPWVWKHSTNNAAPHLTTWGNDFVKKGSKGSVYTLIKCHITYPYQGQEHKPVHVYYKVDKESGVVTSSGIDANRCGGDAQKAKEDATNRTAELLELAKKLIAGAFGG